MDLRFGAIDTTNANEKRERGKKETIRKDPNSSNIYRNILNVKNVCMKMHEHVTCKVKKKTS